MSSYVKLARMKVYLVGHKVKQWQNGEGESLFGKRQTISK